MAVSLSCYATTILNITAFVVASLVSPMTYAKTGTTAGTCRVVDGDTIFVVTPDTRTEVRLSGLAAPETRESGGKQATEFLKTVCEGQPVKCDLDGSKTRGREVGICYVNDATDIGAAVIAKGLTRECARFSGGRYAGLEKLEAKHLAYPGYCSPR